MAAVPFPSYLGAFAEGFPVGTNKYVQESQHAVEICTEKLLNRLSILLFHVDKQIDKVLLQGRFLPKKLNKWLLEARELKYQVRDLLLKQQNRKGDCQIREELVTVGIEMINHLKRCPFKDEYMYDKPIPAIIQKHEHVICTEELSAEGNTVFCKSGGGGWRCQHHGCTESAKGLTEYCIGHGGDSVLLDASASQYSFSGKGMVDEVEVRILEDEDEGSELDSLSSTDVPDTTFAKGSELDSLSSTDVPDTTFAKGSELDSLSSTDVPDTTFAKDRGSGSFSRFCQHLGCTKSAKGLTRYCRAHGGGERCHYEGCPRASRGKSGLCLRHGGGKRCKMESCTKSAEGTSGLCISHGGGRRCQHPECTKGAQGSTMFCKAHGGGIGCTFLGCTKSVHGGTSFCISHGGGKKFSADTEREADDISKSVPENEHYLVSMKDNIINLEMDHQTFLIADCPSSVQLENSSLNVVLNLVGNDLRLLPEKPDYPNSFILFLQRNNRLTQVHNSFFNTMPDLCFLDMSDTKIRILPTSLFSLSKLKVLMLRNCLCLENIPSEIGKLNLMEVLDLSGTELYDLPDEICRLALLRHMQLSFYGPDDESEYAQLPSTLISPTFLSDLKALQSLSIAVHPDDRRWPKIAESIIKDVGRLEMLSSLQFYFTKVEMFEHFIQMSPSWNNHVLSKFKFIVGRNVKRVASRVPNEMESLFNREGQCLRLVNGDTVPQVIQNVLVHVTAFYLDHHTKIESLSEFGISSFQSLKFCLLRECPKIQVIIDNNSTEGAFPCLGYLGVYYLWELEHIWKSPWLSRSFHALTYLTVSTCPKLQFILWESMLPCLSSLMELVVEDCESVEIIVQREKKKVNYDGVKLPGLRKVVLQYLPKLVSLGNGMCISEEKISIYGCPKLILNSQPREQTRVKQRKFLGSLWAALQFK